MTEIAVIQTAFPGDVVLASALFAALKDKFPGCRIVAVVRPESEPLLRNNPSVDSVEKFDKYGEDSGISGIFRLARRLRGCRKAFIVQRHLRSAAIAYLARIPERIGFDNSPARFLYTHRIKYRDDLHEVRRCLSLAEIDDDKYSPIIYFDDRCKSRVRELLGTSGTVGAFAVIAPGSIWPTKRYPYYPGLIHLINEKLNLPVVLLGGREDMELAQSITTDCKDSPLNLVGRTDILESAAIISKAEIAFANDSAPSHLAAAVGTPVVAIFGPTVSGFGFAPYSAGSAVVDIGELYCRPCGRHGHRKCPEKHFRCMMDLAPARIIEASKSLLGR
jgi:heptosyltransferase-2